MPRALAWHFPPFSFPTARGLIADIADALGARGNKLMCCLNAASQSRPASRGGWHPRGPVTGVEIITFFATLAAVSHGVMRHGFVVCFRAVKNLRASLSQQEERSWDSDRANLPRTHGTARSRSCLRPL